MAPLYQILLYLFRGIKPCTMRKKIKQHIEQIVENSPINHGYQDTTWSVLLITYEVNKKT